MPTQLKKLIGCADVVYVNGLTHPEDINAVKQHLNVDEIPSNSHVRMVRAPKPDTETLKSLEKFTLHNVKLSSKHVS